MRGNRRLRLSATLLPLALVCLSSGCLMLETPLFGEKKRMSQLQESAETFGALLRWGRVEEASALLHPESRAEFLAQRHVLGEQIRFTEFEVGPAQTGEDPDEAFVVVRFRAYRLPGIEEIASRDRQRWQREDGRWYLRIDLDRYLGRKTASSGSR